MFSVDSELIFPCIEYDHAVTHHSSSGPVFGMYLSIEYMNSWRASYCAFKGSGSDMGRYKVIDDGKGNSVLTGEGGKGNRFTCVELEVF